MDDVKKPFGTSVRAWRSRLGISQEELAGRAGLHRTYVCDIERGARNVSLESIQKLARALEISVAALFSYADAAGTDLPKRGPARELVDILFVEDDPADAELAVQALQAAGIANRIQVARDGAAALNLLFQEDGGGRTPSRRPQIILLDLSLPKVDGLEVLRRIKGDPRTASIPVIVLTGSSRERDLQASKRLGAEAYIVKPLDFRNLSEVTSQLSLQWALLKSK
jgi:CheY-like chemotaxis protein